MSNLTTLLEVAGNVAFSNLFEVEIGTSQYVKNAFKLHIESINIPGMNINFAVEASTKKNYVQNSTKIRELKLRIRETGQYYFYQYLLSWYKDFYDPITNRYKSGNNPNSALKEAISKTRTLTLKAYNDNEKVFPFIFSASSVMIQNLPSLTLDYSGSKPIIYDITFIVDNVNLTAGSSYSGLDNSLSSTPVNASTTEEEKVVTDRIFDLGDFK